MWPLCVCPVSDGLTQSHGSVNKRWRSHLLHQGSCKLPAGQTDTAIIIQSRRHSPTRTYPSDSDFFHMHSGSSSVSSRMNQTQLELGLKSSAQAMHFARPTHLPDVRDQSSYCSLRGKRGYTSMHWNSFVFFMATQLLPRLASSSIDYCEQKRDGCFYFAFPWELQTSKHHFMTYGQIGSFFNLSRSFWLLLFWQDRQWILQCSCAGLGVKFGHLNL